jgi:hypothetical protein
MSSSAASCMPKQRRKPALIYKDFYRHPPAIGGQKFPACPVSPANFAAHRTAEARWLAAKNLS